MAREYPPRSSVEAIFRGIQQQSDELGALLAQTPSLDTSDIPLDQARDMFAAELAEKISNVEESERVTWLTNFFREVDSLRY